MKKKTKISLSVSLAFLLCFAIWTIAVRSIDVDDIGPYGSFVGFSRMNGFFHSLTGEHYYLYVITDWLGLIPIAVALGFAILGLAQWIRRKSLFKVDRSLFVLGGFYILVIAVYAFFELLSVNYRPILIENRLETSYPSSTTMLVLTVMPTAVIDLCSRLKSLILRRFVKILFPIFTLFMLFGRIISGVHWITDIIGGILVSVGLVMLYYTAANFNNK